MKQTIEVDKLIRKEVIAFMSDMEDTLRKNDHKTGWDMLDYSILFYRIRGEFKEFEEAYNMINSRKNINKKESIQQMRREAIDIANYCMYFCNNYNKDGDII